MTASATARSWWAIGIVKGRSLAIMSSYTSEPSVRYASDRRRPMTRNRCFASSHCVRSSRTNSSRVRRAPDELRTPSTRASFWTMRLTVAFVILVIDALSQVHFKTNVLPSDSEFSSTAHVLDVNDAQSHLRSGVDVFQCRNFDGNQLADRHQFGLSLAKRF